MTAASPELTDLIASHRKQMDELLAAHEQRLAKAQVEFEAMVVDANQKLQQLIRGSEPEPVQKPEAVWSDGFLVLNRPAAELVDDLLSRTGEVLSEVGRLVSTRPKGA